MELSGHIGEVFATRFDPAGHLIASGSMDRSILLWRTYGDCDNYGKLTGHKQAILDLQWSRDSSVLFSASADMTLASWDLETGLRIRRHVGHQEVINCLDVSKRGEEILISGSDDGYIGVSLVWTYLKTCAKDIHRYGIPERRKRSSTSKPDTLLQPLQPLKLGMNYTQAESTTILRSGTCERKQYRTRSSDTTIPSHL
jgi:WD40 repeat protein